MCRYAWVGYRGQGQSKLLLGHIHVRILPSLTTALCPIWQNALPFSLTHTWSQVTVFPVAAMFEIVYGFSAAENARL